MAGHRRSHYRISRRHSRRHSRRTGGAKVIPDRLRKSYRKWCSNLKANKVILDNTIAVNKAEGKRSGMKKFRQSLNKIAGVVCKGHSPMRTLVTAKKQAELARTGTLVTRALDKGLITKPAASSLIVNTKNLLQNTKAVKSPTAGLYTKTGKTYSVNTKAISGVRSSVGKSKMRRSYFNPMGLFGRSYTPK